MLVSIVVRGPNGVIDGRAWSVRKTQLLTWVLAAMTLRVIETTSLRRCQPVCPKSMAEISSGEVMVIVALRTRMRTRTMTRRLLQLLTSGPDHEGEAAIDRKVAIGKEQHIARRLIVELEDVRGLRTINVFDTDRDGIGTGTVQLQRSHLPRFGATSQNLIVLKLVRAA